MSTAIRINDDIYLAAQRVAGAERRALDLAMARMYALFMKAGAHRVYVCESEEEANKLLQR